MIIPYDYQQEAIDAGLRFFRDERIYNGLIVAPTASGKSVIQAGIAMGLEGNTLILQPSIEILEQNYKKLLAHGYKAGIYSASANMRRIYRITFATIGSIVDRAHLFAGFKNIILDEAHVLSDDPHSMYQKFFRRVGGVKILGLTATPYRLTSEDGGALLRFLTRYQPTLFHRCLYYIQNKDLFDKGYVAPLKYYSFDAIDRKVLDVNGAGTDFTASSLRAHYRKIDMPKILAKYALQVLKKRKNILIFTALVEEAISASRFIPGSRVISDQTSQSERKEIIDGFRAGRIRCVINVKVLDTGFDYDELEAVMLGFSTMSLGKYYQVCGRVMRRFKYADGTWKTGWVIDLGGNFGMFGRIEDLTIKENENGKMAVWGKEKQLSDITFTKA